MPVEVLGFWRLLIAALILAAWIFISNLKAKKYSWPDFDQKLIWVFLSGFFFFLHLWTYKFASKNTSVANTMILFASSPLWSSAGAIAFFKEQMTLRLGFAYGLAIVGIYPLAFEHIEFNSFSFLGDLSAVLSAFLYACYMLTGKKARTHYPNSIYAFFQYATCAVFFGLMALMTEKQFVGYSDISWVAVAGLVLLPTLLGHLSLTYLVNYMNLSLMTCGKLIEPMIASVIAYWVFNEVLKPQAWITFILTAISVLILFTPSLLKMRKSARDA